MTVQAQSKEVAQWSIDELLTAMDSRITELLSSPDAVHHKNEALIRTRNVCATVLGRDKVKLSDLTPKREAA